MCDHQKLLQLMSLDGKKHLLSPEQVIRIMKKYIDLLDREETTVKDAVGHCWGSNGNRSRAGECHEQVYPGQISHTMVMGWYARKNENIPYAFAAEALARVQALSFALVMGFQRNMLEGDATTIMQSLMSTKEEGSTISSMWQMEDLLLKASCIADLISFEKQQTRWLTNGQILG